MASVLSHGREIRGRHHAICPGRASHIRLGRGFGERRTAYQQAPYDRPQNAEGLGEDTSQEHAECRDARATSERAQVNDDAEGPSLLAGSREQGAPCACNYKGVSGAHVNDNRLSCAAQESQACCETSRHAAGRFERGSGRDRIPQSGTVHRSGERFKEPWNSVRRSQDQHGQRRLEPRTIDPASQAVGKRRSRDVTGNAVGEQTARAALICAARFSRAPRWRR
jgi:hypothetical protein